MTTNKRGLSENELLEPWRKKVYEDARKGNYWSVKYDVESISGNAHLSENERKTLKQVAIINFIPYHLAILEKMTAKYNLLLDQVLLGVKNTDDMPSFEESDIKNIPTVGIKEILSFYLYSEPSERVGFEYLCKRCLEIGEIAHNNSKVKFDKFVDLFESPDWLKKIKKK